MATPVSAYAHAYASSHSNVRSAADCYTRSAHTYCHTAANASTNRYTTAHAYPGTDGNPGPHAGGNTYSDT